MTLPLTAGTSSTQTLPAGTVSSPPLVASSMAPVRPSLDQVPVRDPARWACVEQRGVPRFLHAAVSYVKGDTYTLVVLGGASFHEEDDDALVLQVPCELEEDHVA